MADEVGLWIGTYPVGLQTGYKAFVGSEQIWPVPAWMVWGAVSIYGRMNTGHDTVVPVDTGDASHASFAIGESPLVGKVYWECEVSSGIDPDAATTGVGIASYVGGAIPTHGIGSVATELDAGSNSTRAFLYSNFAQIGPDYTPHDSGDPLTYRFGFAYNATTRQLWVRQVYPAGPGPWLGGGDPVAGTGAVYTCPGTDPVYIAGSTRSDFAYMWVITNPREWLNPGVTGYSPIDVGAHMTLGGGMANGNTGDSATGTYTVTGGTAPITWRHDGTTPPGVTFSGATRSGTYTTAGTYTSYVTALDAVGRVAQLREVITVASATFTLTGTLPAGVRGQPYSHTLTLGGTFTAPVTIDLASGTLPPGLSWSVSGTTVTLSGTPTTVASYTFVPRATDSSGTPKVATGSSQTVGITAATITVGNGISGGTTGQTASGSYTASGGYGGYTFGTTGTLPTGMSVSSAGVRSGTFSAAGTYNFNVNVTDGFGNTGTLPQTVVVSAITVANGIAGGTTIRVGDAFPAGTYTASGGTSPYTYSIPSGALPTGAAISSGGVRSGTVTGARGTYNWTVRATDAVSAFGDLAQSLNVMANITVSGGFTTATVGTPYSGSYGASGGTPPYTFSSTGTLPSGLSIASNGTRSGTPTVTGTANFTVRATDANGDYQDLPQTVVVSAAATGVNLRAKATGASTAGGTGTWTVPKPTGVATGDLIVIAVHMNDSSGLGAPSGFSSLGILTSTADSAQFGVFYKIADGSEGSTLSGAASSASYADWASQSMAFYGMDPASPLTAATSINANTLATGPLTYTFPTLTPSIDGTMLLAFEGCDVNQRGVTAPAWSTPTGYTAEGQVNSNGAVAQVCTFSKLQTTHTAENVTNTATLASGEQGSQLGYLFGVQPKGPFALTGTLTPTAHVSTAYSSTMSLSGDYVGPVTMSTASGTLPPGLSWGVSGATATLSGTPTTAGTYTFTPRATDSSGTPKVANGPSQTITVTAGTVGIVQTKLNQAATGSTNTITPDAPFTPGNKVVVIINRYSNPVTAVTINGTAATRLTQVTNGTSNSVDIYMGVAGSGSAGVIIDSSAGSSTKIVSIIERDDINVVDQTAVANTTGTSFTATTATTTQAKEFVVAGFVGANNQNVTITPPGSPYTLAHNQPNGFSSAPGAAVYKEVAATGTQSATFTTASSLTGSGVCIATIKLN